MKAKPGDFLIPEEPENVFRYLKEYIGEVPDYVHTMNEYEVLDVKQRQGSQPLYIILGMPTLKENELKLIFGKFKVR